MKTYKSTAFLKMKNIEEAIKKAQDGLIAFASKNGIYENFGQEQVRIIEEKFINISNYHADMNSARNSLKRFDDWCMNYDGI